MLGEGLQEGVSGILFPHNLMLALTVRVHVASPPLVRSFSGSTDPITKSYYKAKAYLRFAYQYTLSNKLRPTIKQLFKKNILISDKSFVKSFLLGKISARCSISTFQWKQFLLVQEYAPQLSVTRVCTWGYGTQINNHLLCFVYLPNWNILHFYNN